MNCNNCAWGLFAPEITNIKCNCAKSKSNGNIVTDCNSCECFVIKPTDEQVEACYMATKMFITNVYGKPTKSFEELKAQFEFVTKNYDFDAALAKELIALPEFQNLQMRLYSQKIEI